MHVLGDWSISVSGKGRIVFPKNLSNRAADFLKFKQHHESFAPGTSPLQPFLIEHGINLATDAVAMHQALGFHSQFEQASANMEIAAEFRNKVWKPVVREIRHAGIFFDCGDWGFTVNDRQKKRQERVRKLAPGMKRTVYSVIIGSVLKKV